MPRDHHVFPRLEADVARGARRDAPDRIPLPPSRVVRAAAELQKDHLTGSRRRVQRVPSASGVGMIAHGASQPVHQVAPHLGPALLMRHHDRMAGQAGTDRHVPVRGMLSYPTQRRKDRVAVRTPVDPKEVGMARARFKVI